MEWLGRIFRDDILMELQEYYNRRFDLCTMGFYETCWIRDTQKGHYNNLTWTQWFDIYGAYMWYERNIFGQKPK